MVTDYLGGSRLSPVPGDLGRGQRAPGDTLEAVLPPRHHRLVLRHYLDPQGRD